MAKKPSKNQEMMTAPQVFRIAVAFLGHKFAGEISGAVIV
jgi:hypothetical protein